MENWAAQPARLGGGKGRESNTDPGESRAETRGKQVPKKGKQGESKGKARGKQGQKRESRFFRAQTDPLFVVLALSEIAPSLPFIILILVQRRENDEKKGKRWQRWREALGRWCGKGQESGFLEF